MVATKEASEPVNQVFPIVYLARHGETAWTLSGQYTGLTDLPLTERGERNARRLEERLRGLSFTKVFTSPLQRARRTCELAGFGAVAEIDPDLVEWNYGDYEGRRSAEIQGSAPAGNCSATGAQEGNRQPRPLRVPTRGQTHTRGDGKRAAFFQRAFLSGACRALDWFGADGWRFFLLSTASLSAVGYDKSCPGPAIRLWNDTHHVGD